MSRPTPRSAQRKRPQPDEPPRVPPCDRLIEYQNGRRYALIPLPVDVVPSPEIPANDGTMLRFVRELPISEVRAERVADRALAALEQQQRAERMKAQIAALTYGAE